ncbi:hypothetical protein SORBI_3001G079150 [Sorghum bicolor]|uniref:Uncharacterized protein n=1 Tax=Sorghum bicolor TaxID=4558 RepID=A0A1Z5S5B1_SORBI|nr:hypothetical protein SORBI_3001G079150 [Sorghum bicolor]
MFLDCCNILPTSRVVLRQREYMTTNAYIFDDEPC